MLRNTPTNRLTRRGFLASAGIVAGATLLPATWLALRHAPPFFRPLTLKAGLLTPPARAYPQLSHNLLAGLRSYHSPFIELEVTPATIGVGYSEVARHSQQLLEAGADLVIAFINPRVAGQLRPLFEAHRRPLIVVDSGANSIAPAYSSPYVFYQSLGHWQAAYALGQWLVQQHGPRIFIAAAFFDSGYDSLNAMQLGVTEAGGEVVQTYVTHLNPTEAGLSSALDAIRATRPDGVLALYSGQPAVEFVQAYTESGLAASIPFAGSGFMAEELSLYGHGARLAGLRTALGWSASTEGDVFTALGFDTARFISEAVQVVGEPYRWGEAPLEIAFEGMRGPARFDQSTHSLLSPLWLREGRVTNGVASNVAVRELASPAATVRLPELHGAWLNPYLCG